ncbi:hypothetical protein GGR57DRAFT_513448 [Xylariaceae sp. FL1272]|nr:hypothetical protein GGR57DRAFT_513448 [Xylariaceae sp. FL1272]
MQFFMTVLLGLAATALGTPTQRTSSTKVKVTAPLYSIPHPLDNTTVPYRCKAKGPDCLVLHANATTDQQIWAKIMCKASFKGKSKGQLRPHAMVPCAPGFKCELAQGADPDHGPHDDPTYPEDPDDGGSDDDDGDSDAFMELEGAEQVEIELLSGGWTRPRNMSAVCVSKTN